MEEVAVKIFCFPNDTSVQCARHGLRARGSGWRPSTGHGSCWQKWCIWRVAVAGLEGRCWPQICPDSPIHAVFLCWIRQLPSPSFFFKLFMHRAMDLEADGRIVEHLGWLPWALSIVVTINGTVLYFFLFSRFVMGDACLGGASMRSHTCF